MPFFPKTLAMRLDVALTVLHRFTMHLLSMTTKRSAGLDRSPYYSQDVALRGCEVRGPASSNSTFMAGSTRAGKVFESGSAAEPSTSSVMGETLLCRLAISKSWVGGPTSHVVET